MDRYVAEDRACRAGHDSMFVADETTMDCIAQPGCAAGSRPFSAEAAVWRKVCELRHKGGAHGTFWARGAPLGRLAFRARVAFLFLTGMANRLRTKKEHY